MKCPECESCVGGDHCTVCGSLLHPDHIQEREDRRRKEWAEGLDKMLREKSAFPGGGLPPDPEVLRMSIWEKPTESKK